MRCRSCQSALDKMVIDLGFAPPSNSYLSKDQLNLPERHYPLRVFVCENCWLAQTEDFVGREEVFDSSYHYFSSTSKHWVDHSEKYAKQIIKDLNLDQSSLVFEIASNDGYLLQHFYAVGISAVGIEPTESTALVAQKRGLETIVDFFGIQLALALKNARGSADLVVGNNVFAHVPDINDFVAGISVLLKSSGVCTLEFPHLMSLLRLNQFDTIYHEHFSYLSIVAIEPLLQRHALHIYKVEKLSTHGGSLRIYICKVDSAHEVEPSVGEIVREELEFGLDSPLGFSRIWDSARRMKRDLLKFLLAENEAGRKVAGYGAAAKGNTFLNFAGIDSDLIDFVVDAAESKQFKYLPGSHIPILPPAELLARKPDTVLILPWNLADEIIEQNSELRDYGTDFYVAIPQIKRL